MVTIDFVRQAALAFEEAEEAPHFDKTSFRIRKKIFATLNVKENRICVKLSLTDQSVFCAFDNTIIYPVPNKWGKQGWTLVNLATVPEAMLKDVLTTSFCEVAPAKLADKYRIL